MKLYLAQHDEAKHPERPHTDGGRTEISKGSAFAVTAGVSVCQMRHDSNRNAEETALIFTEHLSPPKSTVTVAGSSPLDDLHTMAHALQKETEFSMRSTLHGSFDQRLGAGV